MPRLQNFSAGPAAIPTAALEAARDELLDFAGSGASVMEISHRSKEYDAVHNETIELVKELMELPENFKVLFLTGGASMQFAMVPMNLLGENQSADYILTGAWSQAAIKEAKIIGNARVAATTEDQNLFQRIPKQNELDLDPNAAYCHLTSNNTIFGTQWDAFPDTADVPIIADMCSDILSRRFDPNPFGLIYAGAQKNLGPAGVTLVIIRDDLLDRCSDKLPSLLSYKTHANKNSLYNTPPCFNIYMVNKVLHWLKDRGGVEAMEKENQQKADLIYAAIDHSNSFYKNNIAPEDRSQMNVVFRLTSETLEKKFITDAQSAGFIGLKGHRSVGGIRISTYNSKSLDDVKNIVAFMNDFAKNNS